MLFSQIRKIHLRYQIAGFHFIPHLHSGSKAFSFKVDCFQSEMHNPILGLKTIGMQRIGDCRDGSIYRTVNFSVFRNDGDPVSQNFFGKYLIRNLLQRDYLPLYRSQNFCLIHILSSVICE